METKDHFALGYYLLNNNENSFNPLQEKLFLLGNIMPDIWLFSYASGIIERKNLKGHIHSSAKKKVEKHVKYLKNNRGHKYKASFILGILMHYLADSFTYSHSDSYIYGVGPHKRYEHELHQLMWKTFAMSGDEASVKENILNINYAIKDAYSKYERINHSMESECNHIIKSAEEVFLSALQYL